jgi:hypothetical protein
LASHLPSRTLAPAAQRFDARRIFLLLAASLSSTILLKVADIQYLELIYLFQLCVLLLLFPRHGFQLRLLRPAFTLSVLYLLFGMGSFVLALVALRGDFYYPSDIGFLKYPVWITISRMVELAIDVGAMVYLVQLFRVDLKNLIFTLKVYFWVGVAGAVYSILTFPLNYFYEAQLGTYNNNHRMRGFFNEGGPFGVYLISEILVGMVLYRQGWGSRNRIRLAFLPIVVGMIGSQSKSAIFAAALMFLFNALMVQQTGRRLTVLAGILVTASIAAFVPSVSQSISVYANAAAQYEYLSNLSPNDGNYVLGRIAGAFIVPRMIRAHPLLGVGWGNYGIVRNSPEYRGGSAWANFYDSPGLGLLGTAAEVGVPLTVFLIAIFFYPYFYLRRIGAPLVVKNLALMQPVIHIFGGQLNLTHPWLLTAFALGLGYFYRHPFNAPVPEPHPGGILPQRVDDAAGVPAQ